MGLVTAWRVALECGDHQVGQTFKNVCPQHKQIATIKSYTLRREAKLHLVKRTKGVALTISATPWGSHETILRDQACPNWILLQEASISVASSVT